MDKGEEMKKTMWKLLGLLLNERGELGDKEEIQEPEPLSDEEKAILEGDHSEEKEEEEPEEDKPEEKPEEKLKEPEPEKSESGIDKMQKRIDRLTWENKLLREDPEEYYRQFPDRKPAPKEEKPEVKRKDDISQLVVSGTGTDIDGMTLAEAYIHNPVLAADLQYRYYQAKEQEKREAESQATSYQEAAKREISEFQEERAVAMFGTKTLTPEQQAQVTRELTSVMDWMEQTKRGGGVLKDAWYLMNRDKELSGAAASGADALLRSLEDTSRSVSTGNDPGKVTGFERYLTLSDDQMADEIDKMGRGDGKAFQIFKQKAPLSVRKKFPDLFDD